MKNRQDVDRKFFLLFILWNAGSVLRTGPGRVASLGFFLSFHCLWTGKIPHSFWSATGAGSSQKEHLQQWQLSTGCALCWLHMNHFKSGSCVSMSALCPAQGGSWQHAGVPAWSWAAALSCPALIQPQAHQLCAPLAASCIAKMAFFKEAELKPIHGLVVKFE